MNSNRQDHIRLTSHPEPGAKARFPIQWGAPTARERGPVIGTVSKPGLRNVIGTHSGSPVGSTAITSRPAAASAVPMMGKWR